MTTTSASIKLPKSPRPSSSVFLSAPWRNDGAAQVLAGRSAVMSVKVGWSGAATPAGCTSTRETNVWRIPVSRSRRKMLSTRLDGKTRLCGRCLKGRLAPVSALRGWIDRFRERLARCRVRGGVAGLLQPHRAGEVNHKPGPSLPTGTRMIMRRGRGRRRAPPGER